MRKMNEKNISREIFEADATTDNKKYIYKNHYKNVHLIITAINYLMAQDLLIDDVRYPADWFLINVVE